MFREMFEDLPPNVRLMVAMAGVGTPFGAMYVLKRYVCPDWPMVHVILAVAGAVAVICLLAFLVAKFSNE